MTDYDKIITKINNAKSEEQVKTVKNENGELFFSQSDRIRFISSYLDRDPSRRTENAKEVGKLLVKVKQANSLRKDDIALRKSLKDEKKKKTLAYQVLNYKDDLVDKAIEHLLRIGVEVPETPEGKLAIEGKIQKISVEIERLERELAKKNQQKRIYINKKIEESEKLEAARKTLKKKKALVEVLKVFMDATNSYDPEIEFPDGSKKKLSTFSNITIRDFDGEGLTEEKKDFSGNTIENEPTDEPTTGHELTGTPLECLRSGTGSTAKKFFDGIGSVKLTYPFTYFETFVDTSHDDRRWISKHSLTSVLPPYTYGISFLKVLRESKGIEEAIENSGRSDKDKLKKYLKELTEQITYLEAQFGENYTYGVTESKENHGKSYDRWQKTILTKKTNEYPYTQRPDWKKLIELMHKIFPANFQTDEFKVVDKDYYINIKPKDNTKSGWDNVGVGGFFENVSNLPSQYKEKGGGGLMKWIDDNKDSKKRLKEQLTKDVHILKNDLPFKSLVKVWWDSFGKIIDTSRFDFSTTENAAKDKANFEVAYENFQFQMRFVKTMRQILLKIGLITQLDEFDYYLLDIADKKEKGSWMKPNYNFYSGTSLATAIAANKIWTEDFSKIGDLSNLVEDIATDEINVQYLESGGSVNDDAVKVITGESVALQREIDEYEAELVILNGLLEFDGLPSDDKLKKIKNEYNNKENGKWKLSQIIRILGWIKNAKTQITDDEYKSELEPKENELKKVWGKVNEVYPGYSLITLYDSGGTIDKEKIKSVKRGKESGGSSLEDVKTAFEEIMEFVNLEDKQQASLDAIKEEIKNPTDDETPPPPVELKKDKLKELLNAKEDPSDDNWGAWKKVLNRGGNNTIKKEEDIEKLINKSGYNKKDSTIDAEKKIFERWCGHLKGHAYGDAKVDENDPEKQWNEFIKKDPKIVIGALLYFSNYEEASDPDKDKLKAEMKKVKDDEEAKDNVEKVEDSWDETSQKDMTKYLYRKAIGKKFFDHVVEKRTDEPEPKNGGKTEENKSWWPWKFSGDNIARPLTSLILIILLIAGGAVAIFWKNLMEWWNGSTEEEGEIGEDKEKSEDDVE